MKVILDTNIFLRALLSPVGAPACVFEAWREGRFELVTAQTQLDEIRRASRYPKFKAILQPAKIGTMLNNLQNAIILKDLKDINLEINDPNDKFLLAIALTSEADYLITGDRRSGLLEKKHLKRTRIVTAAYFCSEAL